MDIGVKRAGDDANSRDRKAVVSRQSSKRQAQQLSSYDHRTLLIEFKAFSHTSLLNDREGADFGQRLDSCGRYCNFP
jgi:hypothetical protein